MRAPTPCAEPGCPAPAQRNGRCAHHQHTGVSWSTGAHGRKMPRGWDRIRARILARDPVCRIAGPACTLVSTEVDHIIRGAGDHDANLQGACHPCHRDKTQAEATAGRSG